MSTNQINHRQHVICTGPIVNALVRTMRQRLPHSVVDTTVRDMRAERDENPAIAYGDVDVAVVSAKMRDYMACHICRQPINLKDIQFNQCANCGAKIIE